MQANNIQQKTLCRKMGRTFLLFEIQGCHKLTN